MAMAATELEAGGYCGAAACEAARRGRRSARAFYSVLVHHNFGVMDRFPGPRGARLFPFPIAKEVKRARATSSCLFSRVLVRAPSSPFESPTPTARSMGQPSNV